MRHLKTALVAAAAAAITATATIALGAVGDSPDDVDGIELRERTDDAADGTAGDTPTDTGPDDAGTTGAATRSETAVDATEAGEIALEAVGGGEVLRVDADEDDGRLQHEVHVRATDGTYWEIHVDAADGTVRDREVEDDVRDDGGQVAAAEIDQREAEQLALEAADADEVLQAVLDEDDGRPEWDLDLRRADGTLVEVTVDAVDGRVLEIDLDD